MPKGIYDRKPKGAATKSVIPIHDLIPPSEGNPVAYRQRLASGVKKVQQPPIVVTFGKVRITIEVGD